MFQQRRVNYGDRRSIPFVYRIGLQDLVRQITLFVLLERGLPQPYLYAIPRGGLRSLNCTRIGRPSCKRLCSWKTAQEGASVLSNFTNAKADRPPVGKMTSDSSLGEKPLDAFFIPCTGTVHLQSSNKDGYRIYSTPTPDFVPDIGQCNVHSNVF